MANTSLPPPLPPPAAPKAPAAPPRTGEVSDRGVVRRAGVRAARWTLQGVAKLTGDLDVDTAVVDGAASVGGKIVATDLKVDGTVEAVGDVAVGHLLSVDGTARFDGALRAGDVDADGSLRIGGSVDVDRATLWRGALEVKGSLKASRVAGAGRFDVDGPVTAKEVDLVLEQPSRARSIAAETVRVRTRRRPLREPVKLELDRIEADMVELEDVVAEYVRSGQIIAGPGCRIARYDGKVVRAHPTARLGPSSVTPRPHGLWR